MKQDKKRKEKYVVPFFAQIRINDEEDKKGRSRQFKTTNRTEK